MPHSAMQRHPYFFYRDGTLELICRPFLFRLHMAVIQRNLSYLYNLILETCGVDEEEVLPDMLFRYEIPSCERDAFILSLRFIYKGFTDPFLSTRVDPADLDSYCCLIRIAIKYGSPRFQDAINRRISTLNNSQKSRAVIRELVKIPSPDVWQLFEFCRGKNHTHLVAACYFVIAFHHQDLLLDIINPKEIRMIDRGRKKIVNSLIDFTSRGVLPLPECIVQTASGPSRSVPLRRSSRLLILGRKNRCIAEVNKQIKKLYLKARRHEVFDPLDELSIACREVNRKTCMKCEDMYIRYFLDQMLGIVDSLSLYFDLE